MDVTQEVKDLLASVAKDAVAAYVKDAGLDKIDQRYAIIPEEDAGVDEKEQLKLSRKEKFGLMAKAIWNKDYIKAKTLNTELNTKTADPNNMTTDEEGGYLVPDETEASIVGLIPQFGDARDVFSVGSFPMNRDTLKIPKRGTGLSVYYPGEAGSIGTSKLTLDLMTLQCKKAAGIAVLTDELKSFAIVDFVDYITERAAESFAEDEDTQCFATTDTVFTGLFYPDNEFGSSRNADPNALTYEDIISRVYSLPGKYLRNAVWVAHRSVIEQVRYIKDNNDRPIFFEPSLGQNVPMLAGYPVKIVEAAPINNDNLAPGTPFLLLGNTKYSTIKDKKGMRIDTSTEATVDASSAFQNDLTAIRFIRHWSFHPGLVEAYSVLKKAGA